MPANYNHQKKHHGIIGLDVILRALSAGNKGNKHQKRNRGNQ